MAPTQHAAPQLNTPDSALLSRIAQGDQAAYWELRLRYGTTAYAVAYSVLVDPEQAEAAVADAFNLAWSEAGAFVKQGAGSVVAWLSQLTRACALDFRRTA